MSKEPFEPTQNGIYLLLLWPLASVRALKRPQRRHTGRMNKGDGSKGDSNKGASKKDGQNGDLYSKALGTPPPLLPSPLNCRWRVA